MAHDPSCACPLCGGPMSNPPLDFGYLLPDCVFALREAQRSPRCNRDFAELGERRFVRCLFPVPIEGGEEFRFGIWVEVAPDTFDRVLGAWNDPAQYRRLTFDGQVANAFPPLGARIVGAAVSLSTRDATSRPFVVHAGDQALAALLRRGWTREEHLALARLLGA